MNNLFGTGSESKMSRKFEKNGGCQPNYLVDSDLSTKSAAQVIDEKEPRSTASANQKSFEDFLCNIQNDLK